MTMQTELLTTQSHQPKAFTPQSEIDDLILDLLPEQGAWEDEHYLWLTDFTNRLIEVRSGYLEVHAMPTDRHQSILLMLYRLFFAAVESTLGGKVLISPVRLRMSARHFREPDLLLLLDANDPRRQDRFWHGADLVLQVVSRDNPERDLTTKRLEYAAAGIPEYWIVDPRDETISVLTLEGETYRDHGVFARGALAPSRLLEGFSVDVAAVFDAD